MEGDFVSKFYLLKGNLVGERKKNFSSLLHELAALSDTNQIDHFLSNIKPRNHLESLFKIDALIYFKKTPELLEILKENNEIFISKILKHQWFFKDAFKCVDVQNLVNDFIPYLSFSSRRKFLKRIFQILNQEQTDRLYVALYDRYGLWFARKYLHFCSEEKIKYVLNKEEIRLESNQVKYLFDRNEKLFLTYLDYYKNTLQITYNDTNVLNYVGQKKINLLLTLVNNEKVMSSKLGKRTSKKAFEYVKDDIPQNFEKYRHQLNNNVMFRKLGKDFKNIFRNTLPATFKEISVYSSFNILRYIPKSRRWNTFAESCLTKFPDCSIFDFDFSDLSRNCSDRDIIKKKAEMTYKATDENRYLKYMDSSIAIPALKEKINVTSDIYSRKTLVELLVETCSENKDFAGLEAVLKYICFRHRNEDVSFRHSILKTIKNLFELKNLNENHWNYINEQIKIIRIQKEFALWRYNDFSIRYLEFLFKNNKQFKNFLKEYIDDIVDGWNFDTLNLDNPEIERQILIEMFKYSNEGYITNNKGSKKKIFHEILDVLRAFNVKYPEYFIEFELFTSICQYVYDLFNNTRYFTNSECHYECALIDNILIHKSKFPKSFININESMIINIFARVYSIEDTPGLSGSLKNYILKRQRNHLENELMMFFLNKYIHVHPDIDLINWFLENEPHMIQPYFQKIILATNSHRLDLKRCKYYSHFDFDKQLIQFSKSKLQDDTSDDKAAFLKNINVLSSTDDFIEVVRKYLPEKEKLDLEDQQMMEIYKLQCDAVKILHHVIEPHKMLPIVMKFCLGDYLQSAIPVLYSVFNRSPEKQLPFYVDIISKRALSAKKHAVFLACEVLDKNFVVNILSTTEHSNVSLQKHLFLAALKYFTKNPCEQLLNLVITTMSVIDKSDTETLDSLIDYHKSLPLGYTLPYFEKCWTFYESLKEKDVKIEGYLNKILQELVRHPNILKNVSHSFVKHILNTYLSLDSLRYSIDFAIDVILLRESEQQENLDVVFNIISTMKKRQINNFFIKFAEKELDLKFVKLLNNYWNKYFTKVDTFWEHIYLNIWIFYLSKTSQEHFVQNIVIYFGEITKEFTSYAFGIFKDVFTNFLTNLKEIYRYQILEKILLYKKSPEICVLVLNVVKPNRNIECEAIFKNILEILKNVQEPIVTIYYKNYVSDNNLE